MIDDHSRVAYVEAHNDETKETATEVLKNAVAWFAERGVTVKRVLSARMGPRVQPPPAPLSNRESRTHHRVEQPGWASLLVIVDDNKITVADIDDQILIEHTPAALGITYVGNGRPRGPWKDATTDETSPMS